MTILCLYVFSFENVLHCWCTRGEKLQQHLKYIPQLYYKTTRVSASSGSALNRRASRWSLI